MPLVRGIFAGLPTEIHSGLSQQLTGDIAGTRVPPVVVREWKTGSWRHAAPMEIVEILHQLERFNGKFPRAAVEAAVARREEIVPELLRILDDTVNRAAELAAEGDYHAHLYALFLLAQFREIRAYPLLVRFASLPGELLDSLCGDFITEDLGRILASVCGGELAGIQTLIENESTDEWVRGAALSSLVALVAAGQKDRDEIVSYFASLYRGRLERKWSNVWDSLVSYSSDLYAAELLSDIERAYQERLVDPGFITLANVRRDLAIGQEFVLARIVGDPHRRLVSDTVAEMEWWACFHQNRTGDTVRTASASGPPPSGHPHPIRRGTPKIGRNEPCPCRSGKKYKKCCGA